MDGILLVGNGQAGEDSHEELLRLAAEIKDKTDVTVVQVACFKELQTDISDAVLRCVKKGVTRLHVIPWQLAEASLAETEQVARDEAESFRGMRMRFVTHQGDNASLLERVQECLSEALKEEESL